MILSGVQYQIFPPCKVSITASVSTGVVSLFVMYTHPVSCQSSSVLGGKSTILAVKCPVLVIVHVVLGKFLCGNKHLLTVITFKLFVLQFYMVRHCF